MMRWRNKRLWLQDRLGERRTVTKFFWLPRHFGKYWYWLEWGQVQEEVMAIDVGESQREWGRKYAYRWREIRRVGPPEGSEDE